MLGPFDWEITQLIKEADGTVTGCIGKLTVTIDGRVTTVSEVGDVEDPSGNAPAKNNGARAKDASSDAIKRAAMRLGCGLELWVKGDPVLHAALVKEGEIVDPVEADDGDPS